MPTPSRYAERDAPPALRDRLRCSWRFRQGAGEALPTRVLPDGCVDLIRDGRALFVAGPDHCASSAALAPGSELSGVRMAAGAGAAQRRRRPTAVAAGAVRQAPAADRATDSLAIRAARRGRRAEDIAALPSRQCARRGAGTSDGRHGAALAPSGVGRGCVLGLGGGRD
ncbi:DUF6597 domain-containing transcriptional factor [Xanthomonas cerealis]|uniref:DUF6597 domain-containing transcriptional factor n=1 Tax=Xanthomonas cerealis TaxID=3390025 RepID=UPI000A8327AE